MKAMFTLNDGTAYTVSGKFIVCDRCRGTGKHDNPAFAECGFCCDDCKGLRVIGVPDEDNMTPAEREAWATWQTEDAAR